MSETGALDDDRQVSLTARLEAELSTGRRVVLLHDRGWSTSGPADVWARTSVDDVVGTARVVVGPDEPFGTHSREDMAADHWAALAGVLRRDGVHAGGAELSRLPHDVVLSDRLVARLGEARGSRPA